MNVFELAAKIAVDASEFKKGLNTSEKSISDFANKATKTLNTLKKVFVGVVSVATVKKIATGIFDLANATSQLGDRVDKQSQALGMSRKGFQEWDYILSQSGASIDSMGASMRTLNQAILSGNAESVNALKELGLSVENLSGMSQEQAFEATVKALQQLPPGAQKSALAMKLLGRGAQSLMPLLNSSAESVDALKKRAQELGLVMSDEAVDASVAFGDALDDLKRTMTAIKTTVGATFLPALTNGLIAVTNYAGKFRGYVQDAIDTGDWTSLFRNIGGDIAEAARLLWIRVTDTVPILWENAQKALSESNSPFLNIIGELMSGITDAIQYVIDNKETFEGIFSDVSNIIGTIVTTGLEAIKAIFEWIVLHKEETVIAITAIIGAFAASKIAGIVANLNPVVLIISAIAALATLIITNWTEVKEFFGNLWEYISTAAGAAWEIVKQWWETNVATPISTAWSTIQSFFEGLWAAVSTAVTKAWTAFTSWLDTNIYQKVKAAWDSVSKFFVDLWTNIKTKAQAAWDAIKKFWTEDIVGNINKAWETIKGFFEDIWTAVSTAVTNAWNAVKSWWDTNIAANIEAAWNGVLEFFQGIWEGITGAINDAIDAVKTFLGLNGQAKEQPTFEVGGQTYPDPFGVTLDLPEGVTFPLSLSGEPKANGLSFVPKNDYLASLHFGEAVLSRNEAEKWRRGQSGEGGGIDISIFTNAIIAAVRQGMESANIQMDGETVTRHVNRRQAEDFMARRFANA